MINKLWLGVGGLLIAVAIFGCGPKEEAATGERKSPARKAVEEVVTQDFKIYEGAKKSLGKIERESEERSKEMEKELK